MLITSSDPGVAFLHQNWRFKVNVILIGVKTLWSDTGWWSVFSSYLCGSLTSSLRFKLVEFYRPYNRAGILKNEYPQHRQAQNHRKKPSENKRCKNTVRFKQKHPKLIYSEFLGERVRETARCLESMRWEAMEKAPGDLLSYHSVARCAITME